MLFAGCFSIVERADLFEQSIACSDEVLAGCQGFGCGPCGLQNVSFALARS